MGARLPKQFHTDPAARVGHPHARTCEVGNPATLKSGTLNPAVLRLKSAHPTTKTGGRTLEQDGQAVGQDGRKSLTVPMRTKVLDGASGVCEHIVSVFGVVDHGGDRILPGFFAKTLAEKLPKGVWCHDWTIPVAKTLEAMELMPGDERLPEDIRDFGGLYVKAQYNLDTQRGREAFSDVSGGYMDEFSIGFTVTKEAKEKNGVNNLIEGRLFEWSPVLWGMNPLTRHISAKGRTAPATKAPSAEALDLIAKGGELALRDLREKSMDDDLPAAMTWGALYTANNYLFYELYDAVWGWGEYREADIETRAVMLAECIDSFKSMALGAFVSLMTLLTQMDEAEDESEEDGLTALGLDSAALTMDAEMSKSAKARALVTAQLLKRLEQGGGSDLRERALSRLLAEGHKGLHATLKSALAPASTPTPSVAAKSDTDAVGGVPTATPSDTTTPEATETSAGAETTTETPAELEKARALAAQVLALTL